MGQGGGDAAREVRRRVSLWDRSATGPSRRAATRMARPLGVRRRWTVRVLVLLLAALVAVPIVLFAVGSAIGSLMTMIGVTVLVLSMLLISAAVHTAMVLNPGERLGAPGVALRHIRTAALARMASGRPARTPDLRRRIAETRERLSLPMGSGFGGGQATLSLFLLATVVMLLGTKSLGLLHGVADDRYYETLQSLDPASPTYDSDYSAALAERSAAIARTRPLAYGGMGLGLALMLAAAGRSSFVQHRARRRFESLSCPDCGYGLRDAEPAVGPEQLRGVLSGPAACPECGSPWPLIPPPTTQEMLTEAARRAPMTQRRWRW